MFKVLLLSLSLVWTGLSAELYSSTLTRVIDANPERKTVLFRGDLLINRKGRIPFNGLKRGMKLAFAKYKRQTKIKMNWSGTYNLIVISNLTLDNEEEAKVLRTIYKAFGGTESEIPMKTKVTGGNGSWYWWQVNPYYDFDPPEPENISWSRLDELLGSLTREEVEEVLINQSWDGRSLEFVQLIEHLKHLLDTAGGSKPTMIYMHSRRGRNRSAAIEAAYRMRYLSDDIEAAYDHAVKSPKDIFEPQGLKGFLYFYKRYLELYSPE